MIVNIDGEKRTMVIQLNEAAAPKTVLNFKQNVARGFYNGLAFHRVIPNYIVQTGDPLTRDELNRSNWGTGGPGYTIPGEPGLPHVKGAVAMARLNDAMNPNRESSGSQFYICLRSLSKLDGDYTVFGNVTQGLDVLTEMSKVTTDEDDIPTKRIVVETMKLVSSKSRFVREKSKPQKTPGSKPEKEKGGFEKLIERVW
ncbi:MAG: peptidylprolyl isomerase [Verrucomicrobiae bacterium]|nr:peptidylprolyl isomerase [Verrucomicrobiae bacterium]